MLRKALAVTLLAVSFLQCKPKLQKPIFPTEADIRLPSYSKLFALAYTPSDSFLILKNPSDSNGLLGAYTWGKGKIHAAGFTTIGKRRRIAAMSSVFTGMLEQLRCEEAIMAVDNGAYIWSPRLSKRIQQGKVISVAASGQLEKEKLSHLKPDLVISYFIDAAAQADYQLLEKQGIPVMMFQNFLEQHPLGRAEWILVFGALMGKDQEARAFFAEISEHYESTRLRLEETTIKPDVLVNAPYTGTWDVPSGDSYMATLISDAGGNYIFKNHKGAGRVPLSTEQVFQSAANADVWINPGSCRNKTCLRTMDPRVAQFAAFQSTRIFNCTKLLKASGANGWWEYGVIRPDMVLMDLGSIFHPELPWEQSTVFFEEIGHE
jgi:iron complex transport system substrate-binding protein